MPKPGRNDSVNTYVDHCFYTTCALQANPAAAGMESTIEPSFAELEAAQDTAKVLYRLLLKARAVLGFYDITLDALLIRLGQAARYDDAASSTKEVLKLLFGNQRPSDIARPAGSGFGRELDAVELILAAFGELPESAVTVKGLVDEVQQTFTQGKDAFQAFGTAVGELALEARRTVKLRADAWLAFDQLEGELKAKFPGQRKLVRSFFMPKDVPHRRTVAMPPQEEEGEG